MEGAPVEPVAAPGKVSDKVPAELVTEVKGLKPRIVSGEITVLTGFS